MAHDCLEVLGAAIDAGYGRAVLVHYIAVRLGRPIEVRGPLEAHLLSLHPWLVADQVTIGNPAWTPPGTTAEIGRLSAVFKLPGFGHLGGIIALDLQAATLSLVRDATGHANWQLYDPAKRHVNKNSSIMRTVSMPNAHVVLADDQRHLQFVGTVTAADPDGPGGPQPMRIQGAGQLNGKPATFELTADPLATASHRTPYHFTFAERSGDSHIEGSGVLPQPFAFDIVDASFKATGPDLKDLFFLTGIHLIDTGEYQLTGNISRRGLHTEFHDLAATSGGSDLHGSVTVDSSSGGPHLTVDLDSKLLRLSDLGARAAGRATQPKPPLLLSDAMLSVNALRHGGAVVNFRAAELDVGHLPLHGVSAKATIDRAILMVEPFQARLLGGRLNGRLNLDARKDVPTADVDLRITDLELGQLAKKDAEHPPAEGRLQARIRVTGQGTSVHQIAASANGTVRAQLQNGAIRESFAELTGVDLRGLGLLMTKDKQDVPLRCAIANFKASGGTLSSENLIADTDSVLITADGQIHLDSEALDLTVRGHPKSLRLFRLRAPITITGVLLHPALGIQGSKSKLVIVDPGHAKDADCAGLLAQATAEEASTPAPR